jgi:GNAT superfamily N-acetyltransferase
VKIDEVIAKIESKGVIIREIQRDVDVRQLTDFDASFLTERIYRVSVNEMSVEIKEEELNFPLSKNYSFDFIKEDIAEADFAVVAEIEGVIVGFATVIYKEWNNRAILTGLFVLPKIKRKGVGRTLVEAAIDYAKAKSARCLFVETQNINYPAIRFYRKMKFEFCGFDTALYNPADVYSGEIAFYFCKNLLNE